MDLQNVLRVEWTVWELGCWGGNILCRRRCASGQCILYRRQRYGPSPIRRWPPCWKRRARVVCARADKALVDHTMTPGVQHSRGIPEEAEILRSSNSQLENIYQISSRHWTYEHVRGDASNSLSFSRLMKLRKKIDRTNLQLFNNILKTNGFAGKLLYLLLR